MHSATHQAIAAVWRLEAAKLVAVVARMVRDVGVAEELAQDALVAALEHWPRDGVPDNPGAWLMTTAKRRAIDFSGTVAEATGLLRSTLPSLLAAASPFPAE